MPKNNYTKSILKKDTLIDKVIVLTGGRTGLGKAMRKYFSELWAKLVIASRKTEVLEDIAVETTMSTGCVVFPIGCDVSNYAYVENMLDKAKISLGELKYF